MIKGEASLTTQSDAMHTYLEKQKTLTSYVANKKKPLSFPNEALEHVKM